MTGCRARVYFFALGSAATAAAATVDFAATFCIISPGRRNSRRSAKRWKMRVPSRFGWLLGCKRRTRGYKCNSIIYFETEAKDFQEKPLLCPHQRYIECHVEFFLLCALWRLGHQLRNDYSFIISKNELLKALRQFTFFCQK